MEFKGIKCGGVDLIEVTQSWDQRLKFFNAMVQFPSPSRPDIPWDLLIPFQQLRGIRNGVFHSTCPTSVLHALLFSLLHAIYHTIHL
jgi:hypothetical protein